MNSDKVNGMSVGELSFRIDYLNMQLEQLENKIMRKNEEIIDYHLSFCKKRLAKSDRKIQQVDQLLAKAARGTNVYYSKQLEAVFFSGQRKTSTVDTDQKLPWQQQSTQLLG
ncbi:hypothetical protein ABWW58_13175 [Sporolactobacillus sp. STCC-11]|uniref:hypothetical protein n=1 Tax=Sporolactobacillus caesalpiniae TaxID=3230362 RepID=UPI003393EFE4